jgi:hypothetical protein
MDINKILVQLRSEHAHISEIIASVERLAMSGGRRRGRPPKWMSGATTASVPGRRGRPPGSKNKVTPAT